MYKKPSSLPSQRKPNSRGNTVDVVQPRPKYLPAVEKDK